MVQWQTVGNAHNDKGMKRVKDKDEYSRMKRSMRRLKYKKFGMWRPRKWYEKQEM